MPDLVARAQRIRKDVLIAATLRERREADLAWYSLVCFGVPGDIGPGAWHGRGLAERHRLYRMADAAMGTGSCSCARVVRCATEKEARCADISTATNIEYTA